MVGVVLLGVAVVGICGLVVHGTFQAGGAVGFKGLPASGRLSPRRILNFELTRTASEIFLLGLDKVLFEIYKVL